jgi:hypothetical protein
MQDKSGPFSETLDIRAHRHERARSEYRYKVPRDRVYRRAKARALAVVYDINSRMLTDAARQFDGLM